MLHFMVRVCSVLQETTKCFQNATPVCISTDNELVFLLLHILASIGSQCSGFLPDIRRGV